MERKVTAVYTVFSVVAFVFLASWLAYTFFQTRSDNLISAAGTFEDISNSTAISLSSTGRFDAPHFRSFVRSLFMEIPSLDVLTISAPSGGVQYVYARDASDLISPHVANGRWSGAIRYSKLTQNMFSSRLPLTTRSATAPLRVRVVFTILSRANLYSIARSLLILLLSFVILTLIVILVAPLFARRDGAEAATAPPTDSPRRAPPDRNAVSDGEPGETRPHGGSRRPDDSGQTQREPPAQERPVIALGPPPDAATTPDAATAPGAATGPADEIEPAAEPAATGEHAAAAASNPEPARESVQRTAPEEELAGVAEVETLGTASVVDDALPPGVRLPSLREVAGEPEEHAAASSEIAMYQELARESTETSPEELESLEAEEPPQPSRPGPPLSFEITEVDEPPARAVAPQESATGRRSAEEELADIEDFEDLERIDGSRGGEAFDPPPRPRPYRRPASVGLLATDGGGPTLPVADEAPAPNPAPPSESEVGELAVSEVEELPPVGVGAAPTDPSEGTTARDERPTDEGGEPAEPAEAPLPAAVSSKHTRELFNPESGLAWRDHLEQRLSFELDRAASFDQDLAVSVVRFAQPADDVARLNYAREIRTYFPFHDLCFEYGRDAFAIVLPNTDIDQAIRSMENFNDKMNEERPGSPKMIFGLSARNGRLLGSERLLSEAETAIGKAREDGRNLIFALRVDPGKYREFIKSTLK